MRWVEENRLLNLGHHGGIRERGCQKYPWRRLEGFQEFGDRCLYPNAAKGLGELLFRSGAKEGAPRTTTIDSRLE